MVGPDRLPFYMPAALEHLDRLRHTEGRVRDLLAEPAHLEDRGQVRHENATRSQRAHRVLHDSPRLRQIEHDPIEVTFVDAFVDVTHLDVEWDVVAEETVHVGARARREVVADLVARDVPGGPD